MPEKFVVKKGQTGKFRFSLHGRNGKVIATSEAYTTKASCLNGIKAVQNAAGKAIVEDQTTKAWADEQTRAKSAAKTATRPAKAAVKTATRTAKTAANTATKTAARTAKVATGTARAATKTAKTASRSAARAAKQPARAGVRR